MTDVVKEETTMTAVVVKEEETMTDIVVKEETSEQTISDVHNQVVPEAQSTDTSSAQDNIATESVKIEEYAEIDMTMQSDNIIIEDPNNKEDTGAHDGSDVKADKKATETKNGQTSTSMLKNKRDHKKFDPSTLAETDDPVQIRAQVEFYMGDSNLPQDKFMWNLTGGPENKAVSLKVISDFKRMRRFKPYSAVVAALRDSKVLVLEGEEGKEMIKRKHAYQLESEKSKKKTARSVYVKGFGDEEPDTQFKLEAFFQKFSPVESVRLRRTDTNLFKGSAFVEFQSEQAAANFLALTPAPTWEGSDLKIMSKRDYIEEKNKLIQEGIIQPSPSRKIGFWEGKAEKSQTDFHSRGRDDWNKKRDRDHKNGGHGDDGNQKRGGHGGARGRGGHGGQRRHGGHRPKRGRGGRGGQHDRDESRSMNNKNDGADTNKDSATETNNTKAVAGDKRPLEDDGTAEVPAAKKVDIKEEAAAEA